MKKIALFLTTVCFAVSLCFGVACASSSSAGSQSTSQSASGNVDGLEKGSIELDSGVIQLYTYALDASYETQTTLAVLGVTYQGERVQEPLVQWSIKDSEVATVNENGDVFAVGEGSTQVVVSWTAPNGTVAQSECTVLVEVPIVDIEKEVKLYLARTDADNVSFSLSKQDGVTLYDGEIVLYDTTGEERKQIRTSFTNDTCMLYRNDVVSGVRTFCFGTKNKVYYRFTANVVGKIIRTVNDLLNMKNYGTVTQKGNWNDEDLQPKYVFDGYFELGNNLDLSAVTTPISTDIFYDKNVSAQGENPSDFGFVGVFDGCGYTIKGGVYGKAGLFGNIGKKGVVKNVAFVDVTLNNHDGKTYDGSNVGCVLARVLYGTVQDVLIDVIKVNRLDTWGLACGFAKDILDARMVNCVAYYPQENQDGYWSYAQYVRGSSVAVNCYSISGGWYKEGASDGYAYYGGMPATFSGGMTAKKFGATCQEVGFVGFDESMWNFTGDKATFQSASM